MNDRIVYSNDFIFHGQEPGNRAFHDEWYSILQIPVESGTGASFVRMPDCRNEAGETFSRDRFFELSGILNPAPMYFGCDIGRIQSASWQYFRSFFPAGTRFVGSELGLDLRRWLVSENYRFVDLWYHPFKLLDDLFFLVGASDSETYSRLLRYRVPEDRIRFHARYYQTLLNARHLIERLPIEDGCCLFIGQTYQDKSVQDGDRFLSILDRKAKVEELARRHSRVYFVPHPYAERNDEVERYLAETPYVTKLEKVPTYHLLASPKVKTVVSLSSSVLYEAAMFGKKTECLFRPLFDIDGPFAENAHVSVYGDYFSPSFWNAVFCGGSVEPSDPLMEPDLGKFRDMIGATWGFRHLGRLERIEARVQSLESFRRSVQSSKRQPVVGIMGRFRAAIRGFLGKGN